MVSFTPRPLYPGERTPQYRLDERLGGPQNQSECSGKEKTPQP